MGSSFWSTARPLILIFFFILILLFLYYTLLSNPAFIVFTSCEIHYLQNPPPAVFTLLQSNISAHLIHVAHQEAMDGYNVSKKPFFNYHALMWLFFNILRFRKIYIVYTYMCDTYISYTSFKIFLELYGYIFEYRGEIYICCTCSRQTSISISIDP